jgi:hypothetical protein
MRSKKSSLPILIALALLLSAESGSAEIISTPNQTLTQQSSADSCICGDFDSVEMRYRKGAIAVPIGKRVQDWISEAVRAM